MKGKSAHLVSGEEGDGIPMEDGELGEICGVARSKSSQAVAAGGGGLVSSSLL